MAYTKQVWRDLETGGTPITAEKLNHIEDGIEENSNNWDSISLVKATKSNVSLPAGSSPYAQVVFDFDIGSKTILAVNSIQVNRPAACAISSFNPTEDNKLEVWIRNVLNEGTTISINASVMAM